MNPNVTMAGLTWFGLIPSRRLVFAQSVLLLVLLNARTACSGVLYQEDWGAVSHPPSSSSVSVVGWSLSSDYVAGTYYSNSLLGCLDACIASKRFCLDLL